MTISKETRLNIRISPSELTELKEFASSKDMSVSDFVLTAARSYMGKTQGLEERLLEVEKQIDLLKSKIA